MIILHSYPVLKFTPDSGHQVDPPYWSLVLLVNINCTIAINEIHTTRNSFTDEEKEVLGSSFSTTRFDGNQLLNNPSVNGTTWKLLQYQHPLRR